MDEQNNNVPQEQTPSEEQTPQEQPVQNEQKSQPSAPYASFLQRLIAAIIDAILVGIVIGFLNAIIFRSGQEGNPVFINPFQILGWAYFIFMDVQYGATLGKMALGLRVQNETTGANLTWVDALLRETVGKILSGLPIFIGYLWMIGDAKKQTWHDKLAKSVVVRVK